MVENLAKGLGFSSNIPTFLARQVAMFFSLDQSIKAFVAEALRTKSQRSSSPYLETVLLSDTVIHSCSELPVYAKKRNVENGNTDS